MKAAPRLILPAVVLVSLLLTLVRPFYGTGIGLALTLLLQIGLPGFLLARAMPIEAEHPVVRFVWVLACGLGLTIVLGGILRYLNVPVPYYLLALHGLLLALAFVKARWQRGAWRFRWANAPLYALVGAACLALLIAGVQRSRIHFDTEVPTVYTAEVQWMAAEADHFATPDRWLGESSDVQAGNRARLDGWTYAEAAWVWGSGIPAAEFMWHHVTPLFILTLPLIAFATAYVLARRESVAAWCAAALAVFALFTIDALVYPGNENTLYYGAQAVYLDTVRAASTVLIVPLAIFALLGYLAQPKYRAVLPLLLLGHALALMRVRQIFILEIVAGATLAAWWLAAPARRTRPALVLALVLGSFTVLPFQMYLQPALQGTVYLSETTEVALDARSIIARAGASDRIHILEGLFFRVLRGLPLMGDTFVIDPASWFYTPFIGLGMLCALASGWRWRRSFAAQYLFGTTLAITLLVFLPGLTPIYTRLFGSAAAVNLIAGLNYALPTALALGFAGGWLLDRLRATQRVAGGLALAAGAALLFLVTEPLPALYASPRDQIDAMNAAQSARDFTPFERRLLDDLPGAVDVKTTTRILTLERTGGFLVEAFPNVYVAGWESPPSVLAAERHFISPDSPFADAADAAFLREQAITHVIISADSPNLPQLLLQPERYRLLLASSGYLIFGVNPSPPNEADRLFSRMNDALAHAPPPRWSAEGFALERPADPAPWEPIAAAWRGQMAQNPSDLARYGLAMTDLLMNRDDDAQPLWERLDADHPDVPLFAEALAYSQQRRGGDPLPPLLRSLDAPQPYVRVMAARTLLTPDFFYRLQPAQLDRALAVAQDDALAWAQLAEWGQPNAVRERAALLMSAGHYEAADSWLSRILPIELRPSDLIARAGVHLMRGDTDGAQALLRPATDADWLAVRRYLHPDRWTPDANTAAQAYYLLQGKLAERNGQTQAAQAAYRQAAQWGAPSGGSLLSDADTGSLLALTQPGAGMVMQPEIEQQGDTFTVTALFGGFVPAYPPTRLRALVVSPDASTRYGTAEIPASLPASALVRLALPVDLPPGLSPLTPARVIVQSLYSDEVVYDTRTVDTILNPPDAAQMPADAVRPGLRFGDHVALEGYTAALGDGGLKLTLYWQTDAALNEDYQVFVHVLDATGTLVAQQDSAPVENRYPTHTWRGDTLIEDAHRLPLDLPPGDYRVYVGLYRLADLARLPITPATDAVESDALRVYGFHIAS